MLPPVVPPRPQLIAGDGCAESFRLEIDRIWL